MSEDADLGPTTDDDFDEPLDPPADDEPARSPEASDPGGGLFRDVVDEPGERRAPAEDPVLAAAGTGDVQLRDSVAGIYEMVKDLEVQLNHMITINEAAERDLESSRRAVRDLERERDQLLRKLEQAKLDAQTSLELRDELRHMTRENERLAEQLRAAEAKAQAWQEKRGELSARLARAQSEREEANEEVECLEAQLAEVRRYIEKLRTELNAARETRQHEARKTELVESRLHVVTEERDALRQELNESRAALEEIRRSIMDTNMHSQRSYYES